MNFKSSMSDLYDRKRNMNRRNQTQMAPELAQGMTYLKDKKKMYKSIRRRSKLMEGMTNMADDKSIQQQVRTINDQEMKDLEEMQKSFQATMSEWSGKYNNLVKFIVHKPKQYSSCLATCSNSKSHNIDTRSSCMQGCAVGKFTTGSTDFRAGPQPPSVVGALAEAAAAMAVAAAVVAGGALGGVVLAALAEGATLSAAGEAMAAGAVAATTAAVGGTAALATEGMTNPPSPSKDNMHLYSVRQGSTYNNKKDDDIMGAYGPQGYGDKPVIQDTINKGLASDPHYGFAARMFGIGGASEGDTTLDEMIATNPDGLRTTIKQSTTTFLNLLKGVHDQPLVAQMAKANVSPETLNSSLKKLETQWKNIFEKACGQSIGGVGQSSGSFSGHTQYCQSWVNTKEGRSGYYGSRNGMDTSFWTGDLETVTDGLRTDGNSWSHPGIKLANKNDVGNAADASAHRMGCDVLIPPTRPDNDSLGGAGYCICADGTTKVYADEGHPSFSCNDVCAPQNIKKASGDAFYHNTKVWRPVPVVYNPQGPSGYKNYGTSNSNSDGYFLNCDSGGSSPDIESADPCPQGLEQSSYNTVTACGTYEKERPWQYGDPWYDLFSGEVDVGTATHKGRHCVYPQPKGFGKKANRLDRVTIKDNGMGGQIPVGYTTLPTPKELTNTCSTVPFANMYIEILQLKTLEAILEAKAIILYEAVQKSNTARQKTTLQQTEAGRALLKNLNKYKFIYDKYNRNKNKQNLMAGMYEDLNMKKESANISYYIWFILAISGMLMVIRKLKANN